MKEAVIVSIARTAVGKAFKGSLSNSRPDELLANCLNACLIRAKVPAEAIEDVIAGCAMPQGEQGMNLGRIALLKAGIPSSVPGMTINRFCSSGLQAIALACERIQAGGAQAILAGGVESMSMVNFLNARMYPDPALYNTAPNTYLSMGITAENIALKYGISRQECDQFAVESNLKASEAIKKGLFKDEIISTKVTRRQPGKNGQVEVSEGIFEVDEGPRPDTSMEALARLRPAFNPKGVSTAGNSSQVSDGAAAVLVTSKEFAKAHNLTILATFKGFQVAGVPPEIMGIGPCAAVPKLLAQTHTKIGDLKVIELNEAFATQSLAVIRDLKLDPRLVNPNGGAIALGHPLGCTGAKLTVSAINETKRRGGGLALITMCIGGGMGAAGLFEI